MKLNKFIILIPISCAFSSAILADDSFTKPFNNKDYVSISVFLGSRINEDMKDQISGEKVKFSSELTQAIALAWEYDRNAEGELLFSNSKQRMSKQEGDKQDVYVQYLHFGGKLIFTNNSPFSTSLGLGLGGTYFNPAGGDLDSELAFSGNITGGIRYQINSQVALRGDLRFYGTLLNSNSTLFCGNHSCLLTVNGDVYVQTELMAGIEFKF